MYACWVDAVHWVIMLVILKRVVDDGNISVQGATYNVAQ